MYIYSNMSSVVRLILFVDGRLTYLGRYGTQQEAAKEHFGEFAYLNTIEIKQ